MFFTVVVPRPALMKVASSAKFTAGDVGVAVHQCWSMTADSASVCLSAACVEDGLEVAHGLGSSSL
eukprot:4475016-Lingulodinium_polyedra.AAC.1